MSDQLFDVRIVERYGRVRVLASFNKVDKRAALVLLGGALIAGSASRGSQTWVQPRVEVRHDGGPWREQRTEVNGEAVRAFNAHREFTSGRVA